MNHQSLRTFVCVAELGRIDIAADALSYSAPAVSYQIRSLERHLNKDLFKRTRHGLLLTPTGLALLPIARSIVDLVQQMQAV